MAKAPVTNDCDALPRNDPTPSSYARKIEAPTTTQQSMLRKLRAIFSRYWYAFLSDRSSRGRDVAAADCDASSYLVGGDSIDEYVIV